MTFVKRELSRRQLHQSPLLPVLLYIFVQVSSPRVLKSPFFAISIEKELTKSTNQPTCRVRDHLGNIS